MQYTTLHTKFMFILSILAGCSSTCFPNLAAGANTEGVALRYIQANKPYYSIWTAD